MELKPYYEHGGITIYNADCRLVLPHLPKMDAVITDPPYNIGMRYGDCYVDRSHRTAYLDLLRRACRMPSVVLHYPEGIFEVATALCEYPERLVAWTYNANTARQWRMLGWFGISPDFSLVKQPYLNQTDKRIRSLIESGSKGRDLYDWWHEEQVKNVSEEKTEHPCQIPIAVMQKAIAITTSEEIIDPFMGSGTTLVAARNLGRRAIGIEIEEKYCQIAVERLRQEIIEFPNQPLNGCYTPTQEAFSGESWEQAQRRDKG